MMMVICWRVNVKTYAANLCENKANLIISFSNDENFVEAFAIFCGMGISNVRMYETAMVAMAKQQVTRGENL